MWYYAEAGRQLGPVDEEALDALARQGEVKPDTLIWREGMTNWQPYGSVRGVPPPSTYTPPLSSETRYCAECGRPFPASELSMVGSAAVCSTCRPVVTQRAASIPIPVAPAVAGARRYAGFWIRFVARLIDAIIIGCIGFIIRIPLALMIGAGSIGLGAARDPGAVAAAVPMLAGLVGLSILIQVALGIAYEVYFLSTRGATLGKIALGLRVIRADGGPISPGLALGRYCAMWISGFIFFIGYIMAGFDSEKRSLHDRLCETRVIYAK